MKKTNNKREIKIGVVWKVKTVINLTVITSRNRMERQAARDKKKKNQAARVWGQGSFALDLPQSYQQNFPEYYFLKKNSNGDAVDCRLKINK